MFNLTVTVRVAADRVCLPAGTSAVGTEESDQSGPGRTVEEVCIEVEFLHLHLPIPPLRPPPLSNSPPLSAAATPPDRPPPAADQRTRVKPRPTPSTGIMNQTCIPESGKAANLSLRLQETAVLSPGEDVVALLGGEVPWWSSRTLQSVMVALGRTTRAQII